MPENERHQDVKMCVNCGTYPGDPDSGGRCLPCVKKAAHEKQVKLQERRRNNQ